MATLTGGTGSAVRLDTLNIGLWLTGTVSGATPTSMTVTDAGGGFRQFGGTGFAFGADGRFNTGTINSISVSAAGAGAWSIGGLSMSVATFKGHVAAADTAGFLATVFAGNDTLSGHAPLAFDDYLDGFGGHDKLFGGAGNDTLRGGLGNDTLDGQSGIDNMDGGAGADTYVVDSELDIAIDTGGTETDIVQITASVYDLADGSGIENLTLVEGSPAVRGHGNELNNLMVGNSGSNWLFGEFGNDTIFGGKGDDHLDGYWGNDTLYGGDGNDVLDGSQDNDRMEGGLGGDIYVVGQAGDQVIELVGAGKDLVYSRLDDYTLPANVEDLSLLDIPGGIGRNGTGNALDNTIYANHRDNILNGAAGADTMIGYNGNDTYVVDNSGDVVEEILFDDFATGYDTVRSSITFSLVADGDRVKGELEELILTGTAAISGTGNNLANSITGNGAANTLSGLEGNDRLNGGAGADKLIGGKGNDTYRIDSTLDVVIDDGGDANDWVESSISVNLALLGSGQVEHVTLLGAAAINATGNDGANMMLGNSAGNRLTGGAGKDSLYGGDGNDTLDGGIDADAMLGGIGNDTYHAGVGDTVIETGGSGIDTVISSISFGLAVNTKGDVENLTLLAGAGNINGLGNTLANVIIGNEGNNIIIGGQGDDNITGGNGADTIMYTSVLDGHDLISGFDADPAGGQDTLSLDWLFDSLAIATADREARVQVTDRGLFVDVKVDVDGDGATYELFVATINTASVIDKGDDVVMGTL